MGSEGRICEAGWEGDDSCPDRKGEEQESTSPKEGPALRLTEVADPWPLEALRIIAWARHSRFRLDGARFTVWRSGAGEQIHVGQR